MMLARSDLAGQRAKAVEMEAGLGIFGLSPPPYSELAQSEWVSTAYVESIRPCIVCRE